MPTSILLDNFWLVLIFGTVVLAFSLRLRSRKLVAKQPELQTGYDQLFKGYLIYMNIPWVVMGIGMLFGRVPSFFSYFEPRGGDPFVLAFYIVVVGLSILGAWWMFANGGAEFLAKHPGAFGMIQSTKLIKVSSALTLLGGIAVLILIWARPR
jgi:uncharacterized membrane protein YphA (DoxX/SURF4 family)